jgi:hypothetical protein
MPNRNDGHHNHQSHTQNYCCELLLMGWQWDWIHRDSRQQQVGRMMRERKKKAQEMLCNISWAIGKFF